MSLSPPARASYECSKCRFRTGGPMPDWSDPRLPLWDPKGEQLHDRWFLCPDDGGPDSALLTHPDRLYQHFRSKLTIDGKAVRVCTPFMVRSRGANGAITTGPLLSRDHLRREVYLHRFLEARGPDAHIDLQRLHDATESVDDLHIYHDKLWFLPRRWSEEFDAWANKIRGLWVEKRLPWDLATVDQLAEAIDPRLKIEPSDLSKTLYIPVDLTRPIDEQLERLGWTLKEIKAYLYRFTRKGPPRSKTRNVWRDIYIYLLKVACGSAVSAIAEEVFPKESGRSRELKVRQIVNKVGRAARAVGPVLRPDDKLSPPD